MDDATAAIATFVDGFASTFGDSWSWTIADGLLLLRVEAGSRQNDERIPLQLIASSPDPRHAGALMAMVMSERLRCR